MNMFKIDHVHIYSDDIERSVVFYKEVFGASELRRFESQTAIFVHLDVGGTRIVISSKSVHNEGLGHFAVTTNDFEGTLSRLKEFNMDVAGVSKTNAYTNLFIRDPSGVVIEIISPSTK